MILTTPDPKAPKCPDCGKRMVDAIDARDQHRTDDGVTHWFHCIPCHARQGMQEDGDVVVFGKPISERRVQGRIVSVKRGEPLLDRDEIEEALA